MTSEFHKKIRASGEDPVKIQAFDAPAGAFHISRLFGIRHDDNRPVKGLLQLSRHDSGHPFVGVFCIVDRKEIFLHTAAYFIAGFPKNTLLYRFPLTVQRLQFLHQIIQLIFLSSRQKADTYGCIFHSSRCIQMRHDSECHIHRRKMISVQTDPFDQPFQPFPLSSGDPVKPVFHQSPVFTCQRNDIPYGGHTREIQKPVYAAFRQSHSSLKGLRQLESHTAST